MSSLLRRAILLATTACALLAASVAQAATTPVGPGISKEPAPNPTVTAGASTTFSVTATGTPTLKYQWQFKSGATFSNITGATKSTYTITKAAPANAGTYRVIVSNAVGSCASFPASVLTVNPNFAGKYNMAVISYNSTDVMNMVNVNSNSTSGNALYGTATATGTGPFTTSSTIKAYLGDITGGTQTNSGSISTLGVVTIKGTDSVLNVNMIMLNGTPIGFLGTGTPAGGTDNSNDSFILGLNATTTAPTSAAACAGNYTVIIIGYNATAVSKSKPNQNDGDADIGTATVASNGAITISQTRYADGGGDTLGKVQIITGKVSSSGVLSNVVVQTGGGPQNHPVSIKFVTLNGQVIGFTGTFKPLSAQESDSGILIGIKNTSVKPL